MTILEGEKSREKVKTKPDRVLDIRAELCPMTFVRTRLALDRLEPGQTLLVRLGRGEPARSVPAQAAALGHHVLETDASGDGADVLIRKGEPRSP